MKMTEKTNIAHIITKLELGGAQKTTLSFLRYLDKKKYQACLITSLQGYLKQKALFIPQLQVFFVNTFSREIDFFKDVISFFKIARFLKKQNISLVHTHSSKAGIIGRWAAYFAGIRLIVHTVHGWPFYIEKKAPVKFIYRFAEKLTALITTKFIVVSDKDKKEGLKFVDKKESKYVKIPYGIKSCELKNKKLFKSKDKIVRVGFIACYKPQKAPEDFLRVAAKVVREKGNIQFISAGDGILRPSIIKKAAALGLNGQVKFLGWQPDIAGVLSQLDILLLTSRWEGLPVVIIEALAAGVPVVATNVGGVSELVKNGVNGFLAEKGDWEKLADAVLLLAEDKDKRDSFSSQSRANFKKEFEIDHMKNRIESLYNQVIGG